MQSNLKQASLNGKVEIGNPFYDLIQRAYHVFNQAPTEHGVCDCCMYPEIRKDFFNHGQANLPLNYIQDWFFAAAEIPMKKSSWRFVLPRTLEILASGQEPSNTGIEVSLSRFETGDPNNWSSEEWAVLDEFQKLFLTRFDLVYDEFLDDIICMFATAGWKIESLFTQVFEWPTEKLVKQLWKDWCNYPNPDIWITAFWSDDAAPKNFYCSKELIEKITSYALDESTPSELSEKAIAVSDLMLIYSN